MKILGIETSCDETAAGIVENGHKLLSNVVYSSMDLHAVYGGVVPEIAARSHLEVVNQVIDYALTTAKCSWKDIDAIAVTYGAGLSGSLLIGLMSARTLAIAKSIPLYGANHVLGHVYANFLNSTTLANYQLSAQAPKFPMLAIIVSGKHSELVLFHDHFNYKLLGQTHDDAIGEAFDKVSKMLGLGYPGGPAVSKKAQEGEPKSIPLPLAKMPSYDFSFSGLKTAVLRRAQEMIGENYNFPSINLAERLSEAQKANLAASFEYVACRSIVLKANQAAREFQPASVALAGGVAANTELRRQLQEALDSSLFMPDMKLCTDNGAMIATLGSFMAQTGQPLADPFKLGIEPNLTI